MILNGYQQEGFGRWIARLRQTADAPAPARSYGSCEDASNLTIVTHAMTDRVLFSGKRAIGVAYLHHGNAVTVRAPQGTQYAAARSPRRNCCSARGVGRSTWLRELDVPLVHDLPGVGEKSARSSGDVHPVRMQEPVSLYPALQWWNQPAIGLEWMLSGTGIGASNQFEARRLLSYRDDVCGRTSSITSACGDQLQRFRRDQDAQLPGACPFDALAEPWPREAQITRSCRASGILFNYMADPLDWREFRDGIRDTRDIMRRPALDRYRGRELNQART